MPLNVLYTTGIHEEVITFVSVAEKDLWDAGVSAIKSESSTLFNKKENEGLTDEIWDRCLWWIILVKKFKDQFGDSRTPQDIKWALNSAEEALGVAVTQWENPPNAAIFEN